jgi:uncharacterized protein YqeY
MYSEIKEKAMFYRKAFMKNKDAADGVRKSVLTTLKSDIEQVEIDTKVPATDAQIIKKIKSYISSIDDNIANGMDPVNPLIEKEILESLLPQPLTQEQLEEAVNAACAEVKPTSMKDMKAVMAILNENHAGLFDGGTASGLVRGIING